MQLKDSARTSMPGLRVGDMVEVKSREEILATLDKHGELDDLPFMPEMLQFCGRRFPLYRRAVKFCDTKDWTGMHRLDGTVHLQGVRCDGQAHGGCQAGCLLYWREDWLKPVGDDAAPAAEAPESDPIEATGGCTEADLVAATGEGDEADGTRRYSCQATELTRAGPERLPWWDARVYVRDVRAGNSKVLPMVRSILILLFNVFQAGSRRYLPPRLRLIRGGEKFPFVLGRLARTPKATLDLQPGELVRVKSREEILATLDRKGTNRGLSFDGEMLKYCGTQARVLRRVRRIIDEPTGKMLSFNSDCIVLEGVICAADFHQYCPRSIYPYWREIWLERVE